jgi:hypothetical protein
MQASRRGVAPLMALSCLTVGAGGCGPELVEIASGFAVQFGVRPALSEDGTVVAAETTALLVGDGTTFSEVDLAAHDLDLSAVFGRKAVQVRDGGDVVFVANRAGVAGCVSISRGAYHITTSGGPLSVLRESCLFMPEEGRIGSEIAMSPNGTVAVSQIRDGAGDLWRGPFAGPLALLHSGSGTFYNSQGLDVNDGGRVAMQTEYFDGFAGGLMRAVFVFDTPDEPKLELDTAIEKMGIGSQPPVAINAAGTVALSLSGDTTINIGGMPVTYVAGIYRATPTLFNTAKMLELVADLSGPYCSFGNVDINDDGDVVFEAQLDASANCGVVSGSERAYDGLFRGADPTADKVVVRNDAKLGDHRYFDSVRLGELNNADQVSFLTSYSEPLVDPVKVWRADL